jgi:tetratricopeptide (TPR) repeat protein
MSDGRLKTLQTRDDSGLVTVVEAVLATCALQPDFLPVTLPNEPYQYVGPGLGASNPIYHVVSEAVCINYHPPEVYEIALLLSLGSGTPGMISFIRRHYSHHASHERQEDVAADEAAGRALEYAKENGVYFRFSLEQETQGRNLEVNMDDLDSIATQLDLYLRNEDTIKRIEECARILISPDVAAENLALTHCTKGLYYEAKKVQRLVVRHLSHKLGDRHPSTIRARENLAMISLEQCKWVEAEAEVLEVLELQRITRGAQHSRAIEAAATLMAIYSERENWEKAEELQLEILEQKRRILGKDHLEAVRAAANLASIYHMQGKWNEARQLRRQVLERRQESLGEDHPDTILAAESVDATSRAPKEVEAARRWTLNLKAALEERANSSLGAIVDAVSDSSYPHTS